MPLPPSPFANMRHRFPAFGGVGGAGGIGGAGGAGVSLNYVPQQQTIGDPRNAINLAAQLKANPVAAPSSTTPTDMQSLAKLMAQMPGIQNQILDDYTARLRQSDMDSRSRVKFSHAPTLNGGKISDSWFENRLLGKYRFAE